MGINCLRKFLINDLNLRIKINSRNYTTKDIYLNSNWFKEWLVGFTDGDGTFTIDRQNNGTKWNLIFKISQKSNNAQILHFIKKRLGFGNITQSADQNWSFRIRDRKILSQIIFPIFDEFPLVTVKYYDYCLVKKAWQILEDTSLDSNTRNKLKQELFELLKDGPSLDYLSSVWDIPNYLLSKHWITGFWEAEGSFYIVEKEKGKRLCHGFGITQKCDELILIQLSEIFGSVSKVKFNKKGFFALDSTNHQINLNIANFFYDGKINYFVGIKSQQFTIWRRTLKFRGNYNKLIRVRYLLRNYLN